MKIEFKELFKKIRIKCFKPTQIHRKKSKKQKILDLKAKEMLKDF
jgi:hypothetical protein